MHAQLLDIGYTRCKTDPCLYFKRKECDIAIVGVFVDDLLVTTTSPQLVEDFFTSLKSLEVKDLGVVRKILGMHIEFKARRFHFGSRNARAQVRRSAFLGQCKFPNYANHTASRPWR